MSSNDDQNALSIVERLRNERIAALYHFTSIDNLPCIRDMGGLCSKQLLEERSLWPCPNPSGNSLSHDLDRRSGNWDGVSFNLTPHTPMAYHKKREKHLCFFINDLSLAGIAGVVFADTNATASGQTRAEGLRGLDLIDFPMVRSRPQPWDMNWKHKVQAEILVPRHLALEYTTSISFVSEASRQEGERIWGADSHPPFIVEPKYFADSGFSRTVTVGFPYLSDLVLTDTLFDKSKAGDLPTPVTVFERQLNGTITAVAKVKAIAGTNAQTMWSSTGSTSSTEFEKSAEFWHWSKVTIDELKDGNQEFHYYLNGIRWSTIKFEIRAG